MPLLPEGRGDMDGAPDPMTSMEQPMEPQPDMGGAPPTGEAAGPEGAPPAGGDGMKCPYCGAPIEEGWLVCVNCKAMLK